MKTQAWGWLATAVLAAGLNSSYHNGGMEWAHRVADRVGHNTSAVLALATGNADRFLTEAQIIRAHQSPSCPLNTVLAQVQRSIAPLHTGQEEFDAMSAREEAQLARLEANRARMEVQFARLSMVNFNPVVVRAPKIACPRVRVNIPRVNIPEMPTMKMKIKMPAVPVVHVDYSGPGPV